MTLYIGDDPLLQWLPYSKFRNQSQKKFQKFQQMNIFLTNQFLITKMP